MLLTGSADTGHQITAHSLRTQADHAAARGNRNLAANLHRAAELTALSDEEMLDLYELLRPGRATLDQLRHEAAQLRLRALPQVADLLDGAADAYHARGLA
jgi:propanediol dehydratase small subunit